MSTHEPARLRNGTRDDGQREIVAEAFVPLLRTVLGQRLPVRIEFWDGSGLGPDNGPGTLRVHSAGAVRRMMWATGELGLSRAFVAGDIDLDGDVPTMLRALQSAVPG
ncbi:MAG: SAM-dependent methyltransferase, partial [Dactylosporangium sp.]|nr:hypothetical protein [Dactylosporangium sp.]NNJ61146.1 SAM-dependent methyltransferase [Dactylosporangium sp.]